MSVDGLLTKPQKVTWETWMCVACLQI